MLDNFLSRLGAVISRTISHIITPPSPLFPAYYTPRVTFHFFLISNHQVRFIVFFSPTKRLMLFFRPMTLESSSVMRNLRMSCSNSSCLSKNLVSFSNGTKYPSHAKVFFKKTHLHIWLQVYPKTVTHLLYCASKLNTYQILRVVSTKLIYILIANCYENLYTKYHSFNDLLYYVVRCQSHLSSCFAF